MSKLLKIVHLYPKHMSIYGDYGNVICLQQRLTWRGIKYELVNYEIGDKLPSDCHFAFMGGGQDTSQLRVADDLLRHKKQLQDFVESGGPALVICGGYQLFGQYFETKDKQRIDGIEVLDVVTNATNDRMIGNIVVDSEEFGQLVGFENHSGVTQLLLGTRPLGKVAKGYGNEPSKQFEGARKHNVVGSYMHGSLLPKNPVLADWLLQRAMAQAGNTKSLSLLDDWLETSAHQYASKLRV
jgi:CobQ-like glutamine amidotransferase family enzyme